MKKRGSLWSKFSEVVLDNTACEECISWCGNSYKLPQERFETCCVEDKNRDAMRYVVSNIPLLLKMLMQD